MLVDERSTVRLLRVSIFNEQWNDTHGSDSDSKMFDRFRIETWQSRRKDHFENQWLDTRIPL